MSYRKNIVAAFLASVSWDALARTIPAIRETLYIPEDDNDRRWHESFGGVCG